VIDLVFITYNRLYYTKLAIASVLADPTEEFSLTIWDNASTDGTVEYLKHEVNDPRIVDIIFSKWNISQTSVINKIWGRSKADLLGKLDNDCLVTPGWTRTLAQAHKNIDRLGVVACWHFAPEDFDYERAKHKIHKFGEHQIMRHPWVCGTGFLIKRDTFNKLGPIPGNDATKYWLSIAAAGYINGWYYPLIYQEHMDDPKSPHTRLKDEASYQEAKKVTFGINLHGQRTLVDRWYWRQRVLDNLLDDPWDVKYYVGWRRKLRILKTKLRLLRKTK
jgi:glycosyltransferase involved in cell wall biosynthesis